MMRQERVPHKSTAASSLADRLRERSTTFSGPRAIRTRPCLSTSPINITHKLAGGVFTIQLEAHQLALPEIRSIVVLNYAGFGDRRRECPEQDCEKRQNKQPALAPIQDLPPRRGWLESS
jgi:hypothetical protein